MLNTDYKIITKTISNRIKKYITIIIEQSQTGFIKGRYIGENIRLIQETIVKLEDENLPGLLLFADFEKAFDSISHEFMFNCLKCFNFGPDIINWIKCFYSDAKSAVINSGHMTEFFDIKKGLRQGCPLSAYLFIICIELLAAAVRENEDFKGIPIFDKEFKSTLFADDATFALDGSLKSFNELINILEAFKSISGLKLNNSLDLYQAENQVFKPTRLLVLLHCCVGKDWAGPFFPPSKMLGSFYLSSRLLDYIILLLYLNSLNLYQAENQVFKLTSLFVIVGWGKTGPAHSSPPP